MRALLDTNIIIHRENTHTVSNYSIGHLYNWLDRLGMEKAVHPLSIDELNSFQDPVVRDLLKVKLESYTQLQSSANPDEKFLSKISGLSQKSKNDVVDNRLLYEVYIGHADILITEDRGLIRKAEAIGMLGRVYSINRFISKCSAAHPDKIEYNVLKIKQKHFGKINLNSPFFDSFRRDYPGFDEWFNRKCNDTAYVAEDDHGNVFGFLYLKTEGYDESYQDITPAFTTKNRLKIGTFKVDSTGFRLGERFIKIIFDNAIHYKVDEIYVTLFSKKDDIAPLHDLLGRWGFVNFGTKISASGNETVMVKTMGFYNLTVSVKENFPNLTSTCQKFILPILPKYHTDLCPDAILKNESPKDYVSDKACRYALQKIYISFSFERDIHPGDFILMYRNGPEGTSKKYTSVITSIGVVNKIEHSFQTKQEYLNRCQNRSVFTNDELDHFWRTKRANILLVDFIFVKELETKVPLSFLWENGIVATGGGPRPFTRLTEVDFSKILEESGTVISQLY